MSLNPEHLIAGRILAILLSLGFFALAVRNRDKPGSLGFAMFVAGTALWAFAAAVDISTSDYGLSRLVYNVLVFAAELAAVGWLVLAFEVTERLEVSQRMLAGLGGWIVVMQALLWTNPAHQFVLGPATTVENVVLVPEYNPGFWVHAGVSYLFIAVGTGILTLESSQSTGVRRTQTTLLALAILPSVGATLVSLFDVAFAPFDVAPFGFLLTAGVLAVVLFRGRFLDVTPVARRTALEALNDAVLILDDQDRVVDCNRAARELFGITGSVTGLPVTAVLERVDSDVVAALTTADERETEATIRTDGEQRHLRCSSSRIGDDGQRGRVVICYDITERREREQELERTNEQLDQFAGVVSHDLRNPLTVAIGRLEVARQERDSEHLAAVATAHDRMQSLIDDVLTLAREGATVSEMRPVSLSTLATECWADVETESASPLIETDRVVRADKSRLQQLLENLIRNAVEHGGEAVTVTVGDLSDGFFVADDGPGIPIETRDQVFSAGHSTTDTGTGLGLNIAQQIANAHDWEIQVTESEAGGARFEITGVEFVA